MDVWRYEDDLWELFSSSTVEEWKWNLGCQSWGKHPYLLGHSASLKTAVLKKPQEISIRTDYSGKPAIPKASCPKAPLQAVGSLDENVLSTPACSLTSPTALLVMNVQGVS